MYKITVDITDKDHIAILNREYLLATFEGHESELIGELGEMDDDTFEAMREEICENLWFFLMDCFSNVENRILRKKRNVGAEKEKHHFIVYWKNPNAYQNAYKAVGTYKTIEDARDYIQDQFKDEFTSYQIAEVKNNVEKIIEDTPQKTLFDKNYAF